LFCRSVQFVNVGIGGFAVGSFELLDTFDGSVGYPVAIEVFLFDYLHFSSKFQHIMHMLAEFHDIKTVPFQLRKFNYFFALFSTKIGTHDFILAHSYHILQLLQLPF